MSSSSRSSLDSLPTSASAPGLPATSSTSRLILLPNTDDLDPYATGSDEEDNNEDSDPRINQPPLPPLPPSVVFLHLLSPYLRLGAISVSDVGSTSLAYGFTALAVAASLSALCRQIWFLLGRYLRRSSTEDVLAHIFVRRHRGDSRHDLARLAFTAISGLFKLMLAAMYLRDSVNSALLLELPESIPLLSRFNISISLSILVFVLSLHRSLGSRSLVYATGLSVASYLGWLFTVSTYRANKPLLPNLRPLPRGTLWNEFSTFAFACTTAMTVPLSASLTAGTQPVSPASRSARARSFQRLNLFSALLGVFLISPLVVICALPRASKVSTATPNNLLLGMRIVTLTLSIPSVVVSITSLPLHGVAYRFIRTDLALSFITLAILALCLVPPPIASVLDDTMMFMAVFGTFLLPALAHITIHYFRRPLSIVVPPAHPSAPNMHRTSNSERSPSPSRDPLLQRKERLLQRRRFGRRLLWDIVVWIVLIPICVCALVWTTGRLARRW